MKKAFSFMEIMIGVALIAIFFLVFISWTKNSQNYLNKLNKYYDNRNELINKVERGEGAETRITGNIYLKTVSVNNLSLDYISRK